MNPELFDFSESETYNYEKGDAQENAKRIAIFYQLQCCWYEHTIFA